MAVKVQPAPPVRQVAALAADVGPITAQTVLQNITGLGLTLGASATEVWLVAYWLLVNAANATMDVQAGFSVPAGCTMQWGIVGGSMTEVPSWSGRLPSNSPLALATQAGTAVTGTRAGVAGLPVTAIVKGGGTAGTVQIQYAQNTSDAGALKIDAGSTMEATKIAA